MQYTQAQIIALKRQKLIEERKKQSEIFFQKARAEHERNEKIRLAKFEKQQKRK